MTKHLTIVVALTMLAVPSRRTYSAEEYAKDVAPLLAKYCVSCHSNDDREGKLSLETYAEMLKGGEHGPAFLPGNSETSRLVRMLRGSAKPKMPPEDNEAPTAAEIEVLVRWIDAGAKGPAGAEPKRELIYPKLASHHQRQKPVTAVAWSAQQMIAVARFGEIELFDEQMKSIYRYDKLPGKINSCQFSADGQQLVLSGGVTGLRGNAFVLEIANKQMTTFSGHKDVLFAAELSHDGKLLATAGYDRQIHIWDRTTGDRLRTLLGHNDAVYDLAFSKDDAVIASASGDETVKVWRVNDGQRLDTLSQPQGEQYTVEFSQDGKHIAAAGADNRIRVWQFASRHKPRINPLLYSRFAHEAPITALRFNPHGDQLLSVGDDLLLKRWTTDQYVQHDVSAKQDDIVAAVAWSPTGKRVILGRMDGSTSILKYGALVRQATTASNQNETKLPAAGTTNTTQEQEPNNTVTQANALQLPAEVSGAIQGTTGAGDVDTYKIACQAGEEWVVEVNASRSKSALDSFIEVLNADGSRVERVWLQAVRDSYFTFRGKDSDTSDDFRVHNWEEMDLNQYLYANGEVVKLWLYPRGPDSGFKVYPGAGKRYGFFDTTPLAHALHSPCYIVEPHAPGTKLNPNGLPVFRLYYENDDDASRRWGKDSRLSFTAPRTGEYLIRVRDVRGEHGENYKYKLTMRPRRPDYTVRIQGNNPTVNAGSGKEVTFKVERHDDFMGPIKLDIAGLPPGLRANTPVEIEAGQEVAVVTIMADSDAPAPTKDNNQKTQVTAHAVVAGKAVTKTVGTLGEIKLAPAPKLLARIVDSDAKDLQEIVIRPGQTVSARVKIERRGFKGRVSFGNFDAGRNLPHGVYVDNIGLNGLLIVEGKNEREFFITAAKWVPETTRMFYLTARVEGNQTTQPVRLRVIRD